MNFSGKDARFAPRKEDERAKEKRAFDFEDSKKSSLQEGANDIGDLLPFRSALVQKSKEMLTMFEDRHKKLSGEKFDPCFQKCKPL